MAEKQKRSLILVLAAAYNILWGAWVILFPYALFDWAGLPRPLYPQIWQCVGMIVGVYGLGYWLASSDPNRHWPIVLVGFLGKILGPIGFVQAFYEGVFNWKFGLTLITNDLIWWGPFGLLLWRALVHHNSQEDLKMKPKWQDLKLKDGRSIFQRSQEEPLLFVLVRHRGCTFCRESLAQLAQQQKALVERGWTPIVVHMGSEESSQLLKQEYGLEQVEFHSDPDRLFYQAFGARKGKAVELFGPRIWWRGFVAGVVKGHGVGALEGDGFQLGGVYSLVKGTLELLHDPCDAADVENWDELLKKSSLNRLQDPASSPS